MVCVIFVSMLLLTVVQQADSDFTASDKNAIQELVFRDVLHKTAGSRHLVFLAGDPDQQVSDTVLSNLADLKLRVRNASRARRVT
jgi:hypothetical protein